MTAPSADTKPVTAPIEGRRAFEAWVGFALLYVLLRGLAVAGVTPGGDMRVYWGAAQALDAGVLLFAEHVFEYPPLALLMILPPAWVSDSLESYTIAFAAWSVLIDAFVVAGVWRLALGAENDRRRATVAAVMYVVTTGLLGELLVQRLDVGVAALAVLMLLLVKRGGSRGGLLIALSFMTGFKLVGLLLAPLVPLWRREHIDGTWGARLAASAGWTAATAAGSLLLISPFLVTGGASLQQVLGYHAARGLQIESSWASLVILARRVVAFDVKVGFSYGATHLGGELADTLAVANPLIVVAGLAGMWVVVQRRARWMDAERAMIAVWVTFFLLGKVLSPQFLIWIAPALALVVAGARRATLSSAVVMVFALTGFVLHFAYGRLSSLDALAGLLLVARNTGLVVVLLGILDAWPRIQLSERVDRWAELVATVAAACFVALAAIRDITSHDFWLHRFLGGQIVATGSVPTIDAFTALGDGLVFVAHEWLSSIILWAVDDVGGPVALIVLRATLLTVAVAAVHIAAPASARKRWWWWLLLFALVVVLRARLQVRPHLLAFALMALVVVLLRRWRRDEDDRWLLALLPLQVLWANLHASCFLLPGLMMLAALLHGAVDPQPVADPRQSVTVRLAVAAGLCLAVSFLNPRGVTLLSFAIDLFFDPTPRLYVDEWRGAVASFEGTSFQVAFLALGALYAWALWVRWYEGGDRRALVWPLAIGVVAAGLGLTAVRFQAPMSLWMLPELGALVGGLSGRAFDVDRRAPSSVVFISAVLGWLSIGLLNAGVLELSYGRQFPWGASNALREQEVRGVVFNEYDDGGFLLAQHWPQLRPLVDGRVDVLGDAGVEHYRQARVDVRRFEVMLRGWNASAVLLRRNLSINADHLAWLSRDPQWRAAWMDVDHVLYVRREGRTGAFP